MFGDREDDVYGYDLLPASTSQLEEAVRGEPATIQQIDEFLRNGEHIDRPAYDTFSGCHTSADLWWIENFRRSLWPRIPVSPKF